MKVCFFVGFYPCIKGGAEYQMKLIAAELSSDVDSFFISVGHDEDKVFYEDNIKVYAINLGNSNYNKISLYYPFFYRVRKILDIEAPDLIYQRILNSFSFHLASYSKLKNIPFYIHVADCYSLQFGKTLSDRIRKYMFRSILKSNVQFVIQTDEQRLLLSKWNIIPVLKIYNLHPLGQKKDSLVNLNSVQKNIVWIGSARKIKRLDIFLDLAQRFNSNIFWKFVVIGRLESGNDAEELSSRMAKLNNVDYLGEQDNNFINQYLEESATLLVNTSDSEGFSNTFIQAWLRGIPVVSLNSNPDNILTDYQLGIYCDSNTDKLFSSVELLLENSDLANRISINALNESPRLFSLKSNICKIRRVLNLK